MLGIVSLLTPLRLQVMLLIPEICDLKITKQTHVHFLFSVDTYILSTATYFYYGGHRIMTQRKSVTSFVIEYTPRIPDC